MFLRLVTINSLYNHLNFNFCFQYSEMAFPLARLCILVCMSVFCCYLGKADDVPQTCAGGGGGGGAVDPAQIVAKALLCFNQKNIYSSCAESYRLTASGNLNVPRDYTNQYCNGPCLTETQLVLNCIENIMTNFVFYNRATIQDIRDTIQAGCGYGSERGDFNVMEHIEAEGSGANRAATRIPVTLGLMIIGRILFL